MMKSQAMPLYSQGSENEQRLILRHEQFKQRQAMPLYSRRAASTPEGSEPVAIFRYAPLADAVGALRPSAARSPGWEAVEKAHIKKEPCCRVCSGKHDLQVHHKLPFHLHPELELEDSNLVTLCQPHHLLVGHLMLWASYNPAVMKDAAAWAAKIKNRPDHSYKGK